MQRANVLAGKTQCRYCGEQIPVKSLTSHILTQHGRPTRSMAPTLVRKTLPQPQEQ